MPAPTDLAADREAVQRHTIRTLMFTQVWGGVGLAAGATVGSLLAEEISGRVELAGLGGTFQTLGAALLAIPIATLAHRYGRRPSLTFAYAAAVLGALLIVVAAYLSNFAIFLLGSALLGSASGANSAARYAAADLALPAHRGRDLSLVVWVTTIGSVLGPNLAGPAEPLARAMHLASALIAAPCTWMCWPVRSSSARPPSPSPASSCGPGYVRTRWWCRGN